MINMSVESEKAFRKIGTSFKRAVPGQSLTSDPDNPYIIAALAETADIDFTIMGDADEYPVEQSEDLNVLDKSLRKIDGTQEPENFPTEIADKLKNVTPPKRSLLGEK